MAKNSDERKPLPPYIPLKTLTGFIQKLKDTTVPPRVDSSLTRSYSGSTARQLIAAMKWLNLIDDNGYTRDSLRKLVDTHGTDAWGDVFGDVISEAYCDVIGDLDLDNATSKMLAEKFQALGADGQVLQKCITFYLAALRNAGLKVSPHLTEKPPRQRGEKRGRSMRRAGNGQGGSGDDSQATRTESSTPQGMVRFSFPIPDKSAATIILPGDLSADDWAMVSSMVTAYISRREKK